jgi:hypothetical protein
MVLPLIALVALGAASPVLTRHCERFAADPQDPWALAHGIAAFGPSFRARDGRLAHEAILDSLRRSPAGELSFPLEPHPDLLLKTLLRAGLPLDRAFTTAQAGRITLRELARSAGRRFQRSERWEDSAWTLESLARAPDLHAFDVGEVMDEAFSALEAATSELGRGLDEGRALVPKDKHGIYAHPCGGLHFVQALLVWAGRSEARARWGRRLQRQVEILFYRLGSEAAQYEAALTAMPQYRLQVLAQMLKFYGHFLETVRLLDEMRWPLTGPQRAEVTATRGRLLAAVEGLRRLGALGAPQSGRAADPQTVRDLVGDACHAVAGLAPSR